MTKTPTTRFARPPQDLGTARESEEPARAAAGDRLEAPLAAVPYPVEPCRGACLDVRDADGEGEEDVVRYRTARW